jgi:hypothetical protein
MTPRKKKTPRASQQYLGWRAGQKSLLLPVAGEFFLLTLPFIERRYRPNCGRLPLCGLILVEIDLTLRGLNRELPIRRAGQIGNDEKHQRHQRRECY